ncbi:unnamed protein product [Notodromas monacha]|uniref:Ubiquitin-like domain-containing protein n=1 Tax=Notodromas monacha TaxID=399045 RepID=A0A7R9BI82_9CRUS|nr:unnamed protein product [Notodromas monacha]CAG0914397.1 unnamed protein product [Notodromas monacha]
MVIHIVIKASNQMVPDVPIVCQDDWTVHRLKEEICSEYPTKPTVEDQRLIFGGAFLTDDSPLAEVFKQKHIGAEPEEPLSAHTIHLVLNHDVASRVKIVPEVRAKKPSNDPLVVSEDGLRRRINSSGPEAYETRPAGAARLPAYQNEAEARAAYNAVMSWYMVHYRPYYDWYCQTYYGVPLPPPPTGGAASTPGAAPPESPPNPEQPPRNGNNQQMRMDAQGNAFFADDDDEDNAREWDVLDWIYTIARFGVFLSIVYFYSTMTRFGVIVCLALLLQYLHARLRRDNRRQQRNAADAPARQENEQPQQQPEPRPSEPPNEQTESENVAEEEEAPRGIFAIWAFVYAFVSSIFPEVPAN